MKPAQILAVGLLFFLLFMPAFTVVGDLRVECELSEQTDCGEWEIAQSITGVALLFGFMLSVGGAYKSTEYSVHKVLVWLYMLRMLFQTVSTCASRASGSR